MPNRPSPGSTRGSNNAIMAILQALSGGLGGVEANPEFGQVGPTPDGTPIGADPYKARTWFDKNQAGQMNAQYRADEMGKDTNVARALKTESGLNPILAEREQLVGNQKNKNTLGLNRSNKELDLEFAPRENAEKVRHDANQERVVGAEKIKNEITLREALDRLALEFKAKELPLDAEREKVIGGAKNQNELSLIEGKNQIANKQTPIENAEKIKLARIMGAIQTMQTNNVIPDEVNQENYNKFVTPEILAALASKNIADTEGSALSATKFVQDLGILKATAEPTARKALASSEFGAKLAEGQNNEFARIFRNQMRESDQGPLKTESDIVRNGMIPMTEGTSLFNSNVGRMSYTAPPDPMKAFTAKMVQDANGGIPTAQPPTAQPQQYSDSDIIIINGKKYIKTKQ